MARERNSRRSSCEEAYRWDKRTRESSGAFTEHYEFHKVLASRKCAIPVRALNKGTDLLDVPSPVFRPDRSGRDDRTSTRHERAEARASSTSPYNELLKHDKRSSSTSSGSRTTHSKSADLPDPDVLVKIMRKKWKADSLPLQL
jgi:hypothetical protein